VHRIAFPIIVVFMESLYLRTGTPVFKAVAKRWSKIMVTLFAVGVVTGTILTFEFGLLWPNFMGTFGNVFGLAFTLEGISFFLEGILIAIYVYGWDRIGRRTHLLVGVGCAIPGAMGSLMVITVNAWMNQPRGFTLNAHGTVATANPWVALFGHGFVWHELVHMYVAGYIVCGFVIAGVYSWGWLKGRRTAYHRAALIVPLAIACIAAPVQLVIGDWAGRTVAKEQPTKLAAMEGLPRTTAGAPFHLFGVYITRARTRPAGGSRSPSCCLSWPRITPTAR
jgi:cytochrome d ubiquinol oxidase subunit I